MGLGEEDVRVLEGDIGGELAMGYHRGGAVKVTVENGRTTVDSDRNFPTTTSDTEEGTMTGSRAAADETYDTVVLGASIAGLLSALVLAQNGSRVALVERDELPADSSARRGVPQSQSPAHPAGPWPAVLEELMPGFPAALETAGAATFDSGSELMFWTRQGGVGPYSRA